VFRRLCREAVIFMLLGLLLTTISSFIYMHHTEAQRWPPCPPPETITPAPPSQAPQSDPPPSLRGYGCEDPVSHQRLFVVTSDPAPRRKINDLQLALTSATLGLYGFAAGFGIWLFYRLVRFAVEG
jgi:hypothetical protein